MKAVTVQFSDLAPGRDNPAGRWDVGFHALRIGAVRLANGIADHPEEYDARAILALVKNPRERLDLQRAINNAPDRQALYRVLLAHMRLTDPRPELAAGLMNIAQRLAHENALRLTREAAELLNRAQALKT